MRKFVICLFVCVAAMAFFCVAAHAQESQEKPDTAEAIDRIKRALEELSAEGQLTEEEIERVKSRLKYRDRLQEIKSRLEEIDSRERELIQEARQLLRRLEDSRFQQASEVFEKGDFAAAAGLLNAVLEDDPKWPEALELFEKILPSICPRVYHKRWYWAYSRFKKGLSRFEQQETTLSELKAALRWLHFHQDKDGRWDQDGFAKNCDTRKSAKCDGKGTSQYDVGVTGLALLAFMGSGYTHRVGDFKETVKKGINWLVAQQKEDGSIGKTEAESWIYNHAIATQALCEAYALTCDPKLKEQCEKAVEFIIKVQNKDSGWKYEPQSNRGGSSITAWTLLAVNAARNAGFSVEKSVFEGALNWFDHVTDERGHVGCKRLGHRGCDIYGRCEFYEKLPSMTAAAVLCRILCKQKTNEKKIAKSVDLLMKNLPDWNKPKNTKVDFYYWFFGTYSMFQYGGKDWHKWNTAMKKALLDTQRVGGCADGSWDPVGKWGMVGGRVYATAMNCLTLEVYYRYTRAGSDKKNKRDE